MKVVIQRSLNSKVIIDNKEVGSIKEGLTLLVGFTDGDDEQVLDKMIDKIINLRIFDDENGVMNKSLMDVKGEVLSISQFTLYADTSKGRRPSYVKAMEPSKASALYDEFNKRLAAFTNVKTGIFGADMQVSLTNNGPVTIILEY